MRRTADTPTASTVPQPRGKPGGPGLFHVKGLQLPPYVQHVRDELMKQGHPESEATGMAVGIVRNWAEGHDGHGRKVHPDVQAAAAKNIAQWEKDRAEAHASGGSKARRSAVADSKKPYGDVTYADPKNGKYPIDTEEHARAALAYISMPKNASQYPMNGVTLSEVKGRIVAACKKFGIDVSDDSGDGDSASRLEPWRPEYMRFYAVEDMHIMRTGDGDSSGRVVEAFAAVFDQPAEIQDFQGHYQEVIDRSAFSRAIDHIERQRGGLANVKVLYNHGMTLQGTPSERFSVPIGVPVLIRTEERGLLTRTRYSETPLADEILESVRAGTINSQSFTGKIWSSSPELRRGRQYRPSSDGELPIVRRTRLGLREYGPVLWPAYSGAEIVGVRMSTPGAMALDQDEASEEQALPPDEGPAAGDQLPREEEHSARYDGQHDLYVLRSQKLREEAGLAF